MGRRRARRAEPGRARPSEALLGLDPTRLLDRRPHPQLVRQGADLVVRIAPVAPQGPQEGKLALLGPPGHGLRRHVEKTGHLGGPQVRWPAGPAHRSPPLHGCRPGLALSVVPGGDYRCRAYPLNLLYYLARFDPVVLPAAYDCELALDPYRFAPSGRLEAVREARRRGRRGTRSTSGASGGSRR